MIYNAKEGILQTSRGRTVYLSFGTGERPLIMIQGLNTNGIKGAAVSMAFLYRIFARDYRVYLFERREQVPPNITVRDMAEDLAAAMDALGLRDAHVLGVSQGGMIAQYLAIDRPDLVGKLVLAVTAARNNDTLTDTVRRWIELTERGEMRELVTDMAERMYSAAYVRRYRPFLPLLTVLQKPKDVNRFLALTRACLTCDSYEDLDRITCPTLVIGGREDKVVGGAASEEIAHRLGCECCLYDGLGHAAYEEAKDFNRRVYDFLMGVE